MPSRRCSDVQQLLREEWQQVVRGLGDVPGPEDWDLRFGDFSCGRYVHIHISNTNISDFSYLSNLPKLPIYLISSHVIYALSLV